MDIEQKNVYITISVQEIVWFYYIPSNSEGKSECMFDK